MRYPSFFYFTEQQRPTLVSGSKDRTVCVWNEQNKGNKKKSALPIGWEVSHTFASTAVVNVVLLVCSLPAFSSQVDERQQPVGWWYRRCAALLEDREPKME